MFFQKGYEESRTSCGSLINPLTVIQTTFLERFFKYLLSDVFGTSLSSMADELDSSKTLDSSSKHLAQSLFRINRDLSSQKIVSKMGQYLTEKSPSFLKGELNKLIESKYCNVQGTTYKKNQILFTEVKMNAGYQALQQVPLYMKKQLQSFDRKQSPFIYDTLKNYEEDSINFLIVYFGKYDFSLAQTTNFSETSITIFGKSFKLKIQVIYVSRVGLAETFKTINRMPHLEEINDLIIELYEFKRVRAKQRRRKQSLKKIEEEKKQKVRFSSLKKNEKVGSIEKYGVKALLGITAVGVAVAIGKIFG